MQEVLNRSDEVIRMNIKQELEKMEEELNCMIIESNKLTVRLSKIFWDVSNKLKEEQAPWT